LTIETKIYGKYHLEVARDLRTLALTYMMQKEIKLAKQADKMALSVDKKFQSISLVEIG
jgi:hypothetical protein